MQISTIWYCGAETPLSFSALRSAVGAFLLARGRGEGWMVLPDAAATPGKIARLRRELHWIGADADEFYPATRASHDCGCTAAAHLITDGRAYCGDVHKRRRVFFRLPEIPVLRNVIATVGPKGMMLQPNMTVEISRQGIFWRGADEICRRCSFAAMPELVLRRDDGRELFNARERSRQLEYGKRFRIVGAAHAEFRGREVVFADADGAMRCFPLEQLDDPVIIDEAGHPSPLLRRVLAAIEKGASVLAGAGLDEKAAALLTLLFDAFGYPPPRFQLLPPADIGDAPDYASGRRMGLLPEAFFQEMARLTCGRPPETESVSQDVWIRRYRHRDFRRDYCRYEPEKLRELNRKLLGALPPEEFVRRAAPYALKNVAREPGFAELAKSKQAAVRVLSEAAGWRV